MYSKTRRKWSWAHPGACLKINETPAEIGLGPELKKFCRLPQFQKTPAEMGLKKIEEILEFASKSVETRRKRIWVIIKTKPPEVNYFSTYRGRSGFGS